MYPDAANNATARGKECQKEIGPNYMTYTGNGAPQQRFKNGGNPALEPETAKIATVGAVFEPLKGLAFTADYWNIHIDNAITAVPPQTVFSNCYEGGLQNFCGAITRDPISHTIQTVFDLEQNVGSVQTSGMDFGASYFSKLAFGVVRAGVEAQYLFKYDIDTGGFDPNPNAKPGQTLVLHGRGYYDLGVLPTLRANIFGVYQHPSGFGVGLNIRYIGDYKECDSDNCQPTPEAARCWRLRDGRHLLRLHGQERCWYHADRGRYQQLPRRAAAHRLQRRCAELGRVGLRFHGPVLLPAPVAAVLIVRPARQQSSG
jgi:hypothetical protein